MCAHPTFLCVEQGTTQRIVFREIRDADGVLFDPTGSTVHAQVRPRQNSDTVLHEWSTASGNVETALGTVSLVVKPDESSDWAWSLGVYDAELTDTNGDVTRLGTGLIYVSRETTRS